MPDPRRILGSITLTALVAVVPVIALVSAQGGTPPDLYPAPLELRGSWDCSDDSSVCTGEEFGLVHAKGIGSDPIAEFWGHTVAHVGVDGDPSRLELHGLLSNHMSDAGEKGAVHVQWHAWEELCEQGSDGTYYNCMRAQVDLGSSVINTRDAELPIVLEAELPDEYRVLMVEVRACGGPTPERRQEHRADNCTVGYDRHEFEFPGEATPLTLREG